MYFLAFCSFEDTKVVQKEHTNNISLHKIMLNVKSISIHTRLKECFVLQEHFT